MNEYVIAYETGSNSEYVGTAWVADGTIRARMLDKESAAEALVLIDRFTGEAEAGTRLLPIGPVPSPVAKLDSSNEIQLAAIIELLHHMPVLAGRLVVQRTTPDRTRLPVIHKGAVVY